MHGSRSALALLALALALALAGCTELPPSETETTTETETGLASPVKIVFITEERFQGDFGGLEGADQKCQSAAAAIGLTGTFFAWLSDGTGSPSTRFTRSEIPYVMLDGTLVAYDWDDLVDGTLENPIVENEKGGITTGHAFTNTTRSGEAWDLMDCTDWTSNFGPIPGNGYPPNNDETWTEGGRDSNCSDELHLFCFEQ